jgi:hypothetical protein
LERHSFARRRHSTRHRIASRQPAGTDTLIPVSQSNRTRAALEIPAAVGVSFTDWRPRRGALPGVDDGVLTEVDPTRLAQ